ncbi:MAG: hypothetical protein V4620_08435 [Bacteroidota bacterium]
MDLSLTMLSFGILYQESPEKNPEPPDPEKQIPNKQPERHIPDIPQENPDPTKQPDEDDPAKIQPPPIKDPEKVLPLTLIGWV